jgi:hypothetical protein
MIAPKLQASKSQQLHTLRLNYHYLEFVSRLQGAIPGHAKSCCDDVRVIRNVPLYLLTNCIHRTAILTSLNRN